MTELLYRNVVDVGAARDTVLSSTRRLEVEQAGVINALGRTLAEDVAAGADLPPHYTAATDGYAAISSDTNGVTTKTPCSLGLLSASSSPHTKHLEPGTVMKVHQGDRLPLGADTVVPSGAAFAPDGGPEVFIRAESHPGDNIIVPGSFASAGEVAIDRGTVIGPGEMGLIASLGLPGVAVTRKPRLAVITTGASVVDIVDEMEGGQVRNSARYTLVGMVLESGCDLGRLIHVTDGRVGLERALAESMTSDAIIVALGRDDKHDMAIQAMNNSGALCFERILMEPGAATAFGTVDEKSVFITADHAVLEVFEALIRPALLTMLGGAEVDRTLVRATLGRTVKPNAGPRHYIKATLAWKKDVFVATPLPAHRAQPRKWTQPNCLIVIPENRNIVKRGETVEALALGS